MNSKGVKTLALDPVTREYINTATQTIKSAIGNNSYPNFQNLEHFEKEACSCSPLRQEQASLEEAKTKASAPLQAERAKLQKRRDDADRRIRELREQEIELHRPLTQRQEELRRQIREIDIKEHGPINSIYKMSRDWVKMWVTEKVSSGAELPAAEHLTKAYLDELAKGWRPRPPKVTAR